MLGKNRIAKDICCNNKSKIPTLIKKVKMLEFKKINDLICINTLSNSIYREWLDMRIKHKKKSLNKIINMGLIAEYEAAEELVVSLLCLLNEKIINFIITSNEKITK